MRALRGPWLAACCCAACGETGDDAGFRNLDPGADAAAAGGSGGGGGGGGGAGAAGGGADASPDAGPKHGPPYPIVLAHGFFGFEQFAGVDFATYFYQVRDHLASHGEPLVFTPAVDPFNDSTHRGAELANHVAAILEETGHARVNLIGHSQGGLDARVVAHDHANRVASVTTVATPHGGTPIADVVLGLAQSDQATALIDWLVQMAAAPLYDAAGNETALSKPMHLFSQPGIAAFNAEYTDAAGVQYFSVTGRTGLHPGGADCVVAGAPDFVASFAGVLDASDPLLAPTEALLDGGLADPFPNDGLVRVKDARWGAFLGCVPADHLDQIGHLFGDAPGLTNPWRHLDFYAGLVAFLRAQGL
jgi:triacylglycerol lipase